MLHLLLINNILYLVRPQGVKDFDIDTIVLSGDHRKGLSIKRDVSAELVGDLMSRQMPMSLENKILFLPKDQR